MGNAAGTRDHPFHHHPAVQQTVKKAARAPSCQSSAAAAPAARSHQRGSPLPALATARSPPAPGAPSPARAATNPQQLSAGFEASFLCSPTLLRGGPTAPPKPVRTRRAPAAGELAEAGGRAARRGSARWPGTASAALTEGDCVSGIISLTFLQQTFLSYAFVFERSHFRPEHRSVGLGT